MGIKVTIWIVGIGALLLLASRFAVFVSEISREASFLKTAIRQSASYDERRHWKKELQALYLSMVPGITRERAIRIVRRGKK